MRQQRTVGAIVEIPLEAGKKAYGRILGEASFAFYDYVNDGEPVVLADLVAKPILFIVAVYSDAVTQGRWQKIGRLPLEPTLQTLPLKFIQDALDETRFKVYDNGVIRPATREACVGLERVAVWEPEHVESRLSDHYKGQPNEWVIQLRMR
ncbi:immunity 26/phosphotriesterase HocA family protein [Hymenobacter lapidiphilus]|uniref:Immunity 26/phosphotriesterase HocA family protein n=1 Tax=Hymenobacter lapidiphilus TaxID=2608003 RepID=A0A7Y7U7C2_9BACT|nr:immunity 26/phosphotriesterase HocA family protein [Hymenobacter lapidiphilus]NVO33403.1 immunity 26/phosphotriesterase HocA family protein [Hymenobacter lapidiphilus]